MLPQPHPQQAPRTSLFTRRRGSRIAGDPDETAAALRDIERQGYHLAGLAHLCAGVLILLFSLGSLISLSAEAFNTVLASWQRGALDIPAAISVAVSTLLVLAMDTAMLYAASVLRMLFTRGASRDEQQLHLLAMVGACILEALTYTYMSWLYDRPATWVLWVIVLARALAAPLYAVYLSMARPLPVGPRDIFAQAELAAGRGVLRDVTTLANDASASLDKKLRMYGAAAIMPDRERARLAELIGAVSEPDTTAALDSAPAPLAILPPASALAAAVYHTSVRSDTGPGDPDPTPDGPGGPGRGRKRNRRNVTPPTPLAPRGPLLMLASDPPASTRTRRGDSGRRSADAQARWQADCTRAADALKLDPAMSTRELGRRLDVRPERATEIRRHVQPVRPPRAHASYSAADRTGAGNPGGSEATA